jgi:hypothetical protein
MSTPQRRRIRYPAVPHTHRSRRTGAVGGQSRTKQRDGALQGVLDQTLPEVLQMSMLIRLINVSAGASQFAAAPQLLRTVAPRLCDAC